MKIVDTGCEDLVVKMLKSLFSVVRFALRPHGSSILHCVLLLSCIFSFVLVLVLSHNLYFYDAKLK